MREKEFSDAFGFILFPWIGLVVWSISLLGVGNCNGNTGLKFFRYLMSVVNCVLALQARTLLNRALEDRNFDSLVDAKLQNNYDNSEMARMVACAAACVRHSARRRPRMSQVILLK